MAEVALALGVKGENLVLEEVSKDTSDQARLVRDFVREDLFILVTSASHMPRAMALFRRQGLHPVPAPTDYQIKNSQEIRPTRFYPTANGLMKSQRAFYEYSVLFWTKVKEIGTGTKD